MLDNLISNAERHTKHGTITLSLSRGEHAQVICVSDTGSGMSKEMQKNAFRGYVSEDQDYWRHGIGLYVCHQIVERMEEAFGLRAGKVREPAYFSRFRRLYKHHH